MNIFALDPDPAIAASMHCDQHLHKMVLESAQMLSTWAHENHSELSPYIYTSSYRNHPCNRWLLQSRANICWLISLCHELQNIRYSLGSEEHSSMKVINHIASYLNPEEDVGPVHHIFCGAPELNLRSDLTVHERYQKYYIQKFHQWLDTRQPMSYKGRPLPQFLSPYKDSIQHG